VALASFDGSVLFLALPAVATDFHAQVPALSNLGSVLALGVVGALPLSALADRAGRRRLLALGVAGFSIADLGSAFAQNLGELAVARLLAIAFEAMVAGVATTLVVEEMPDHRRALALAGLALAGGAGAAVTTVAYPLLAPRWRLLYLAGGIGLLAVPLLWRWLPESRRWRAAGAAESISRLLWLRPWRGRLLVLAVSSALGAVLYEPVALFAALFASRSLHMTPFAISAVVVASGVMATAGFLAGGWLSDRLGRRAMGTVLAITSAAAVAATFAFGLPGYWTGNVGGSLLAGAAGPVISAWLAELFPTRARATAEAAGSVAGAAGGVIGLQLIGVLAAQVGLGEALTLCGVGGVAGAALLVVLPETRGAPLPD
jgi:MFS family permease